MSVVVRRRPVPDGRRAGRARDVAVTAGLHVGSVLGALALCAGLVTLTGGSWRRVFTALVEGSITSPGAWGLTLGAAAPLLLVAVGTIVATRAGLVNIGQEGQLLIGAACCAFCATRLGGPGWVVVTASLACAAVGGGLWSGVAAGMRAARGVPEVISTLLLVFVAVQVVNLALTREWLLLERADRVNKLNTGEPLPPGAHLPDLRLFGTTVDTGSLLALAVAVVVAVVLTRTVVGFRLRMLGLNPRAAHRAGVPAGRYGALALAASGAVAGIGGGVLLTSGVAGDRITPGYSGNIGWQGLLVALLARNRPLVAIPMAVVFAALRTGSGFLAATGVERRIADVVQATLVLALLVPPAVLALRDRRRPRRPALVAEPEPPSAPTSEEGAARATAGTVPA